MPTWSGSTAGASGTGAELPRRIVLVGFMAAGKTSVGRRLARRLERPFVDLDAEVERLAGRSIPEIFRAEGEAAFRELEARATRELELPERAVVAAGGGWMSRPELRDAFEDAVRVWLRVEAREVLDRLEGELDSRPLLAGPSPETAVRALLQERRRDYARAELRVETTGRSPEAVVEAVLRAAAGAAGSRARDEARARDGQRDDER